MLKNKKLVDIIEGTILIIIGIIIYFLDIKITSLTILYVFPIYLIFSGLSYLYLMGRNESFNNKKQIIILTLGLTTILISFYIISNSINSKNDFFTIFAIFLIIKSISEYILINNKINLIKLLFSLAITILIILNTDLVIKYINYLITLVITFGIFKVILGLKN